MDSKSYMLGRQLSTSDSKRFESNREQVANELRGCQERTLQTLVPTIIAVGLIAIADRENFALITLVSSFAVLFCSGLYLASLAYKIFRNGAYLTALDELDPESAVHSWGAALSRFHELSQPPRIIGYETTTVALIYAVFSGAFFLMFYEIHLLLASALALVLFAVALRLFLIPRNGASYLNDWRQVLKDIELADDTNA
ncbi:hypothetical protein HMF8227_01748 [Saliniradius amylolyticus]|uniref:Uncharacterized protein n=1 Tax=Saliniradius amylolyticus TaxID=2183582 RepID=A0A2S2E3K4_9ALTE|nr:hypothetical protein [Saliniradius amylolyticus]AWL12221.1 hypothetical protein HMF8227_01748 [Saliniradius amylolyticus]